MDKNKKSDHDTLKKALKWMTTIHNTVQSLDNMCNLMLIVIFQVEKYIREDQSSNQIIGYVKLI